MAWVRGASCPASSAIPATASHGRVAHRGQVGPQFPAVEHLSYAAGSAMHTACFQSRSDPPTKDLLDLGIESEHELIVIKLCCPDDRCSNILRRQGTSDTKQTVCLQKQHRLIRSQLSCWLVGSELCVERVDELGIEPEACSPPGIRTVACK